ncbi:MAG: outer membrane protein assembly factor BamE [Actinobacteria bacterium]|nr:outer membrane protein assembly factor BamE [Actinomycetota bacterium]
MKYIIFSIFLLGILVACFYIPISATQEDEIFELKRRIASLEIRVEKLEKLLDPSPEKIEPSSQELWKNKANWRQLRIGMSENQVIDLLGEPVKIDVTISFIYWYYPNALSGSVMFDKSNRKLESWTEP